MTLSTPTQKPDGMMSVSKRNFTDIFSEIGIDVENIDDKTPISEHLPVNTVKPEEKYASLDYIQRRASKILDILTKIKTSKMKENDALISILQENELMRREIRTLASNVYDPDNESRFERIDAKLQSVIVSQPNGCYLKIELYPLIGKPIKGGYNVYFEVKDAVSRYIYENRVKFPQDKRFTLVYQRVTTGDLILAKGRCDNDNFEMKRVTNAISDAIGIADSVDKFSFFYTTIQGKEDKTEVFLLPEIDVFRQ